MKKLLKTMMSCLLIMALVMTSFPETVNAADSKEKAVTVSTQKNLENALSDSSNTSIRISTKKTTTFTVPQGNYAGVTLVVDAGKATVKNSGTFSKLIIDNAKKLSEYATGNTIVVNDDRLTFKTAKGSKISKLAIKSKSGKITIGNKGIISKLNVGGSTAIDLAQNGRIGRITLSAPTEVNISGNSRCRQSAGALGSGSGIKKSGI